MIVQITKNKLDPGISSATLCVCPPLTVHNILKCPPTFCLNHHFFAHRPNVPYNLLCYVTGVKGSIDIAQKFLARACKSVHGKW